MSEIKVDLISRDEAVECCFNGWNKDFNEIAEDIKKLPTYPANLVKESGVLVKDLVSRKDLLNAIWQKEYGKDYDGVNLLKIKHIDIIENMPSYNSIQTKLNGDLISKKSVLNLRKYNLVGGIHTVNVADIENLPTYSAEQTDSIMRDATKKEQESVDNYIKSISVKMIPITVLEDIKDEIAEYRNNFIIAGRKDLASAVDNCLKIIDNHISGKE